MKGYFVWAFMDNFEWGSYVPRFGLVYVNYNNNLTRTAKTSAYWYKEKTGKITEWALGEGEYPYQSVEEFASDFILSY